MKKYMYFLIVACLLAVLPLGVQATEAETTEAAPVREPYQCGEDMTWSYDGGTLTISGNGAMDDYPDGDAPWLEYKDSITTVAISGNVTSIGACAFTDYDNLTAVDFGSAMHTIHYRAFKGCDGLTSIILPASFRRFGEESFMSCRNLTQIHCRGGMPSFNANCVWDTYCNIYYPSNNPWPAEHTTQLFQAFQGRVQFYMESLTEVTPVQTTPPATEATEPPTTAPAMEPETVPPTTERETEPATEASQPTEAPTQEPTEPQMTEPEWLHETQPQEEQEPERNMSGLWFGLFIITGTLSLVLIGALVFRRKF